MHGAGFGSRLKMCRTLSVKCNHLPRFERGLPGSKPGVLPVKLQGQTGGEVDSQFFTHESDLDIAALIKKIEILFELLDNIFSNFEYMKELQYRYNFYVGYLFLIIRESVKDLNLETYQYISKPKIILYQKIFQNINKAFTNIKDSDKKSEKESEKGLIFLNTYHYLTIHRLNKLMEYILQNFKVDNNYVDINNCTGDIYNDLIMFNHFRQIIIKFCKSQEGQTITQITDGEITEL